MRAHEIIRQVLDIIDNAETEDPNANIYDDEARQLNQIKDLRSGQQATEYSNSPAEEYSDLDSVTKDAGAGPNKPKHPDDIRGNSFKIYRGSN